MSLPGPSIDDLRIQRDSRPEPRAKPWAVVAALLLLVAGGAGFWGWSRPEAVEVRTVAAREAAAGAPGSGERTVLNASGYVTARRAATVSSKVTGKVVAVEIEEGMKVTEGQVLARLDDTNIQTSLRFAEAQLESTRISLDETRALLKQADREFARAKDLARKDVASQSDLDKAESDAISLRARLARQERDVIVAERQVDVWRQQVEDSVIRAPFSGIVTTKDAQPGEMISPVSAGGGFTRTGIGTIVDMESLEIEIDVNESYINRVEPRQPVEATLDAYPDWKIPCKVIAIIPTADRQKATVKVRVGFDKLDRRILPQMGVKVAFRETGGGSAPSARGVIIPKSAVHQQDGRDVVWVASNDHAEQRTVSVASLRDEEATVSAGVSAGERVVVESQKPLTEGGAVREKKP